MRKLAQAIFDDIGGFKVKEKVVKVVPKRVKSIKDISVDELKVLCFYNHGGVCYWLASDLQSCLGICYGWICLKEKVIKEFKKKGNKFYIHMLDIVDKVECLKGFRATEERMDGRKIMQVRVDMK